MKKTLGEVNYHESYGVFCVAMFINNLDREGWEGNIDLLWEKAIQTYDKFLKSEYNNKNKSELDCINTYMQEEYNEFELIVKALEQSTNDFSVDLGAFLEEECGLTRKQVTKRFDGFYDANNIVMSSITIDNVKDILTDNDSSLKEFEKFLGHR